MTQLLLRMAGMCPGQPHQGTISLQVPGRPRPALVTRQTAGKWQRWVVVAAHRKCSMLFDYCAVAVPQAGCIQHALQARFHANNHMCHEGRIIASSNHGWPSLQITMPLITHSISNIHATKHHSSCVMYFLAALKCMQPGFCADCVIKYPNK